MDAYFPIAMDNVTIEDLKRAQRMQNCMDRLQAKLEDCYDKHVKPLQEIMKVKNEIRITISTITSGGQVRMYYRYPKDCLKAEEIVNRFILNTRTRWIRVIMHVGNGVWEELSFLDCRVPQPKYELPLPF